jgi:hypothetical protein
MKTFNQFLKQTAPPASPNQKPLRKIAGHTFAEEQIEEPEPEVPEQ